MEQSYPLSVGLEVPPDAMAVAYGATAHHAAVVSLGTSGRRHWAIDPLVRQLQATSQPLVLVYAAGPGGDGLDRSLTQKGQVCWGIAPSLLPPTPGDRGKTNRRAALQLARLRRSGDLTPVSVPQVAEAALRALGRARAEPSRARKAVQCQRKALLRRHDSRYPGRATWGPAPLRGLSAVGWPTPAPHRVFPEDVRTGTEHTERRERFAQARTAQGQPWRLRAVVAALPPWRGVQYFHRMRLGIVFPPVCVCVYTAPRDITFLQKYRLVILQRLVALVFPQVPNAGRQLLPEAVACTPWFGLGRYLPLDSDTVVVFPDTRSTTPRWSHT